MKRSPLIGPAIGLATVTVGLALLWMSYLASKLQVFPGFGFVVHLSLRSVIPGAVGIAAVAAGLGVLLRRRPVY